jgi:ubiquinol-cytochrome c reductase cytochrome b subunit/menaquinol-cytochrome c reductase cytochrome b/c subunit
MQAGKLVTAASGCLGCHRFGENGNSGPGPQLTNIGARLPKQAIARTLINPTAPMPSYEKLREDDPKRFNDMVEFLASLK